MAEQRHRSVWRAAEMAPAFDERKSPFTYGEYLTWDDDERWELIDGIPYNMIPAPSTQHQRILTELARQFSNYFQGKPCEVFVAPFDVRLPKSGEADEAVSTSQILSLSAIRQSSTGGDAAAPLILS